MVLTRAKQRELRVGMPRADLPGSLFGRDREIDACESLFSNVRNEGGALLLRGAAGIGKTSLLNAARARADALGFRILSTTGSEAEATFAFAGLQPLLLPVIDVDTGMPGHLRLALRSALGLVDTAIPALATVGLAVLGLLSGVATEETPLCLLVDDVHWLDASTAEVLRFISRRISADPIVLLAAARDDGWPAIDVFPELRVGPLDAPAADALLSSRARELPATVRRRVLAQAAGNPLGLVELSGAPADSWRDAVRAPPEEVLPLTPRLERAFMQRAGSLSAETRAVLLAAALAPAATVPEVLGAATLLVGRTVELAAFDVAVLDRLVEIDGRRIRFCHPLIRSGVVHGATLSGRQAAHEALSRVLEDRARRLHHRAEATVGYDDELASQLDEVADLAMRSGSIASAVAALDQAAVLSAPGPRRGSRLARAAELSFELGQVAESRRFLLRADDDELARADLAVARRLAIAVDSPDNDDLGPIWELIDLAEQAMAADDKDGALRLLEFAAIKTSWGEPGIEAGRAIVAAARQVSASDDPRFIALLALALPVDAHLELGDCLARLKDARITDPESQRLVAFAAEIVGDHERSARLLERAEQPIRKEARLALLAMVLMFRGIAAFASGEWIVAEEVLDEAERLAEETAQAALLNQTRYLRAGLAGMCGDGERHHRIIGELASSFRRMGASHRDSHLNFMRGIAAVMLGRADEAIALLGGLYDTANPMFDARIGYDAMFYLADAAAVAGRDDVVHGAIEKMRAAVPAPWPPILQSAVDYAQALTTDEAEAGDRFDAALAGPAGGRPFDRARVQLAYGRWLRRRQQRLEAREHLRAARDTFDQLGNEPFAQRARDELRATGEGSPPRRNADWDQLSPQELHISRLVAEGLSNKEIGERLFLSHRTIASHLHRIFPKLGVTTRAQLAAVIRSQ
jgi:DNA-binding CsgD family transcriptional regulator/tetratricopeptide (TPR) repeat protein